MIYFVLAVFVLILLFTLIPIDIRIEIRKNDENSRMYLGLRTFFGLLNLGIEIPFMEIIIKNGRLGLRYKSEVVNRSFNKLFASFKKFMSMEESEGLYKKYKNNKARIIPVLKYLRTRLSIKDISIKLNIGTGDAAETGIIYGLAWMIIGGVFTLLRSFKIKNEPEISVIPVFDKIQTNVDFNCIIRMKLGHIINAGIRSMNPFPKSIRK